LFIAGLRERASNVVNSRSNGRMKPISVDFDIVLNPLITVNLTED